MGTQTKTEFRYRYVPYGTRFVGAAGLRTESGPPEQSHQLYENEIATDVGSVCWGHAGESLPVIDHHFKREGGQFPSAAAAVIHHTARIKEQLSGKFDTIWLVSHREPDFDALSSLFLVRAILDGSLPADGWREFGIRPDIWSGACDEISWYQPVTGPIPDNRRWGVLLAAAAARVDMGRRSKCPRHRALNAVLYAAIQRGRPYLSETSGGLEFFDEVRKRLSDPEGPRLDPFFDSVLEGSAAFAPELALLNREPELYDRDMRRAKKLVVHLPESRVPFNGWYDQVRCRPLLDSRERLNEIQRQPPDQGHCSADGLFLRDPESLLFKEWARNDLDNSSMGQGFLFTAIVYSDGRPGAVRNKSEDFFAIDFERARGRHLYPVWARLQEAEIGSLVASPKSDLARELEANETKAQADGKSHCRAGFEERAGQYKAYFNDPWFDGVNYDCTIVPTPNRGTLLGPAGTESDLSDDPVAALVEDELTSKFFSGEVYLVEHSAETGSTGTERAVSFPSLRNVPQPQSDSFRFLWAGLSEEANLVAGSLAEQIGTQLWRRLDAENRVGLPTDFLQRHLVRASDWVAIWSRRGCVVAAKLSARSRVEGWQRLFERMCWLVAQMQALLSEMRTPAADPRATDARPPSTVDEAKSLVRRSESLLCEAVQLRQDLAVPENALLRRFFEASRLDELVGLLRDVNSAAVEREQAQQAREVAAQQTKIAESMDSNVHALVSLQQKVEYVEIGIVFVYAAELLHTLGECFFPHNHRYVGVSILAFSGLAALVTALGLQPWKHHERHARSGRFSLTIGVLLTALLVALVIFLYPGEGWFNDLNAWWYGTCDNTSHAVGPVPLILPRY